MSASVVAGIQFTFETTVYDLLGNPVEGLTSSNFDVTLRRRSLVDAYVSASEAVTVTDFGDGRYGFTFEAATDADDYHSYWLKVVEQDNFTNSREFVHDLYAPVSSEIVLSYSEDDAFCSTDDVEALIGTLLTTNTRPNRADTIGFMVRRAEEIESVLIDERYPATPDSGSAPISTTSQSGRVLRGLCRTANAYAAAGDFVYANAMRAKGGTIPERAIGLYDMHATAMNNIRTHIRAALVKRGKAKQQGDRTLPTIDLGTGF